MKFLRAMKKIKIKKQIIAAVMACVLGIGGIYSVHASVINDAKNKKNEAQQELDNLAATNKCPQCGFGNNAGAKFCISCGAPLNQTPVAPAQSAPGKCCDKCGALNDAEAYSVRSVGID